MNLRRLRQRCRDRLRGLPIPQPFDLATLCATVASKRGRPILLLPMALPADGPCGLWIAGESQDYIVFEQATSRLHQEHIVLHEIGHLLFQHAAGSTLTDEHTRLVFPHLDPGLVRRVLARTSYSSEEECEAEMIASLILQRAERPSAVTSRVDPETAAILSRLEANITPTQPGHDG